MKSNVFNCGAKKSAPPRILVRKSVPQILTQHHAFYYHIDETIRGTDSLTPSSWKKKLPHQSFKFEKPKWIFKIRDTGSNLVSLVYQKKKTKEKKTSVILFPEKI